MTECDIRNWIRVNNNALAYFGGITTTITPDNCKVAVARNKDWISPVLNKDFQAWAEHNNTVLTPAKVKSPRWKPVVEGHVNIVTMHILVDMEDMIFYSLDDLNRVLMEKVEAENRKPPNELCRVLDLSVSNNSFPLSSYSLTSVSKTD